MARKSKAEYVNEHIDYSRKRDAVAVDEEYRSMAFEAAKDLNYSDHAIKRILAATTSTEITRIMKQERDRKFDELERHDQQLRKLGIKNV